MSDARDYVVGTFEPVDVEYRVEPNVREYIEANGLMDEIVLDAVGRMRDWYDTVSGDAAAELLRYALRDVVGKEKLEELES